MNSNVNIEDLKTDAIHIFNNGYTCSEAVVYVLKKHFDFDVSSDAIAMSSGFAGGLGGCGCICGAVAGGVMCLGFIFGRRKPNDPCIKHCQTLTKEFHDRFKKEFESTCCYPLMLGLEKADPKRKENCGKLVAFAVETTAEIIMRELAKR